MKHIKFFIGKQEIRLLHIASGLFFLAGVGLFIWFFLQSNYQSNSFTTEDITPPEKAKPVCVYHRILDGVCVTSTEEVQPKLVVVMIENHLDARPQSGLSKASVVYEAPVEANYSRFMALFPVTDVVAKAGPVRSARPYYLDWVSEYGEPLYMHVGGSADALDKLKRGNYFDFNEFWRGDYFWRSKDRYAPHNAYTSSENWNNAWKDYGKDTYSVSDESWLFGDVAPCTVNCATQIIASFLPPIYEAEWKYSSSTEKYLRYQLNKPHVDQDGTQISADTLVVQHVQTTVLDEVGRIEMDTIGSGKVLVFTKGNVVEGIWKKTTRSAKTRFYDASGKEISFTSGKIWIEVVNDRGEVEYK